MTIIKCGQSFLESCVCILAAFTPHPDVWGWMSFLMMKRTGSQEPLQLVDPGLKESWELEVMKNCTNSG